MIVLQAAEHAQSDEGNLLENFVQALSADQQRLDKLESSIAAVLVRLSTLELKKQSGFRSPAFTSSEVDRLMRASHQIHSLGNRVSPHSGTADMTINIAGDKNGSVTVLPALVA